MIALVRHGETADAVRLATAMLASPAEQLRRTIGVLRREVGRIDEPLLRAVLGREAPRMSAVRCARRASASSPPSARRCTLRLA